MDVAKMARQLDRQFDESQVHTTTSRGDIVWRVANTDATLLLSVTSGELWVYYQGQRVARLDLDNCPQDDASSFVMNFLYAQAKTQGWV